MRFYTSQNLITGSCAILDTKLKDHCSIFWKTKSIFISILRKRPWFYRANKRIVHLANFLCMPSLCLGIRGYTKIRNRPCKIGIVTAIPDKTIINIILIFIILCQTTPGSNLIHSFCLLEANSLFSSPCPCHPPRSTGFPMPASSFSPSLLRKWLLPHYLPSFPDSSFHSSPSSETPLKAHFHQPY